MKPKARAARNKMNSSNIIYFFLALLFILLPFNALINTFFSEKMGIELVKMWKEMLVLMVGVVFLASNWRVIPKIMKQNYLKFAWGGAFLLFVLFNWGLKGFDLGLVRALRLDLLPVVVVIVGYFVGLKNDKLRFDNLIKLLIGSTCVSILASLILYGVGGSEILINLGFRNDWSTYYAGEALAFCQRIENSEICRFQGFLSGPNQLASFLVLIFGLSLSQFKEKWIKLLLGVGFGLVIALTFSRSGMLAFIALAGLYTAWEYRVLIVDKWKWICGLIAIFLIGITFIGYEFIVNFFSRPESSSEHLRLWLEGLRFWREAPVFGNGIGSVGPAARYITSDALIPESWILQVAGQYGLVGLILWVGWYGEVCKNLSRKGGYGIMLVWIALLIPLNLLHIFEASSLVYGLGIVTGIKTGSKSTEE